MRLQDHLLVSGNHIFGRRRRIGPGITDVVDAFHHDDVRDTGLSQRVVFESRERVDAERVGALAEDTVAGDGAVHDRNGNRGLLRQQSALELIGPPIVRVERRTAAVGDGVSEGNETFYGSGRLDLNTIDNEPVFDCRRDRQLFFPGMIPGLRDVVRLDCRVVHG